MGPGNNDELTLKDLLVNTKTSLRGGDGTGDKLLKDGTNQQLGSAPVIIGFETNDFA